MRAKTRQQTSEATRKKVLKIARELGYDPAKLLELLKRWEQAGVIRRIGLVLRHRQLGFSANSMCVWTVAADRLQAATRDEIGGRPVIRAEEEPVRVLRFDQRQQIQQVARDGAFPDAAGRWSSAKRTWLFSL